VIARFFLCVLKIESTLRMAFIFVHSTSKIYRMKKVLLLIALVLIGTTTYSQKKKGSKGATTSALAKVNNLSVELIQNNLYLFVANKGAKKDTILLKKYEVKGTPIDCKITPFTTKGTALHLISWSENSINETKDKTENKTELYSEIWNTVTKTKPLANIQTTTKIKEIQYLDKLKNASQTVEKIRNEGFAFTLTKEGDVNLKNKTQDNTLSYNASSNVYQNVKDIAPKATPQKKK